jgi:hypothetical protein
MSMTDEFKRTLTASGLSHLYRDAERRQMNFDPGQQKLVCMSDLHRGKRDGADDFRRSERVYNAALAWYDANRYHLALLGDVEELWECKPSEVLDGTEQKTETGYARTLSLERRFNADGRYLRVYGNHDRLWASRSAVTKWLTRHLGSVEVYGAVRIAVGGLIARLDGGRAPEILLTHGDAGALDSTVLAPISKRFVHFWAYWQKRIGAFTGMPADDWDLREGQDIGLYEWAAAQEPRLLLIAGHTHRPVFATRHPPEPPDTDAIRVLEQEVDKRRVAEARAAGEFRIAEMRRALQQRSAAKQDRPCYFNTGACCFGDGDITAIEITDGCIRLMRWAWHPDEHEVRAEVLEEKPLQDVFAAIHGHQVSPDPPEPPSVSEVRVVHQDSPPAVATSPAAGGLSVTIS